MYRFIKTSAFILAGLFSLLSLDLHAQWTQIGADIDGAANLDHSGSSVSLSADGTTVAIGAAKNAGGGPQRGHVRVYKNIGGSWTQQGADINGEADGDNSGASVSLSADGATVAIGAIFNAGDGGFQRGHVRVYKYIGGAWTQQGADIDGEANGDFSGYSVSLSANGTTVAIGAPNNLGGSQHGHVRVYKYIGGIWTQQGTDIDGEADDDQSGYSISLSADGTKVAIGAPENAGGGSLRGHVRVYKNIGGTWTQQGADINGETNDDISGTSVSLSADGTTVAIGAIFNAGDGGFERGHVRVYKNIKGTWTQQGADIDGEMDDDNSGYSVSLSGDGSTVAIGAPFKSSGTLRGQVRVYKNNGGTWTKQGTDIDGEADVDLSGSSVSLSADGSTVAIGAPYNAGDGGFERGHVRVYSYCSQNQKFLNAILALAKQKGKKLYVCHQGVNTLQVSVNEFYFHLFHGDKLGKCEANYCGGLEIRGDGLDDFISTEEDLSVKESMVLYPNPAGQILNVKLPFHLDQAIQIQVYNSLGQSMINQPYYFSGKGHPTIPVNIQRLPQGLYFLKASGEGYEASRPFTKF